MKEIEYRNFRLESWEDKSGEGKQETMALKFYACAFGNVDSYNDIIAPGACDSFLAGEMAARMKMCWQHDIREVIGTIDAKEVDERGLLVTATILPTSRGKDAMTLIRGGGLNEFSIGYYADAYHYEKMEGIEEEVRILDSITILEASVVSIAANPMASLVSAKSEDKEEYIRNASDSELEALKTRIETEQLSRLIAEL